MEDIETAFKVYGTDEPQQTLRQVSVGSLSFLYSPEGLRRLSWNGTELVRALAWPIRDENWGTYPFELLEETVDESEGFEAVLKFTVGGGRLSCDLRIRGDVSGEVVADLTMSPSEKPFSTNRAGFTVLHPIKGVAGSAIHVTHANGDHEQTVFPELVRPDQPVKDIAGLCHSVDGQTVDIVFEGEVFEMEDQRNWSDASFKTYCVPLVHPFTYEITKPTRQLIRMSFSGGAAGTAAPDVAPALRVERTRGVTPQVGLALEEGWLPQSPSAMDFPGTHVLLRLSPADDLERLADALKRFPSFDLEVVLPDDAEPGDTLRKIANALAEQGLSPVHVIALRESYLASHQPVGPWPSGPTPNDLLDQVRSAFPKSKVGGGMLTNFTELNRCRPDAARCDYITHGLTPLVHAGDDMSVLETLETLPQIFASAEALAKGKSYRLGLSSIGMRSNPYGAAVAENPAQVRRTMAQVDPRHRGLFGAAFAVGLLAATEGSTVEALCLAALAGPFGLFHQPAFYPQVGFDGTGRLVFPLYHVVKAAAAMAGHQRLSISGLPTRVVGYGATDGATDRVLLANLSEQSQQITTEISARILRLDTDSFDAATRLADWAETARTEEGTHLALAPLSVAFLEMRSTGQA